MELVDRQPAVAVDEADYRRLLGYPQNAELSERARELAAWARGWYAEHGRPWMYAREAASAESAEGEIEIEGVRFSDRPLARARGAVLVAVGAGIELEEEAARLWESEKPDEYFFLDVYGAAVVEHLMARAGQRLCEWAREKQIGMLPHRSPGYQGWDIGEQPRLLGLMRAGLPCRVDALESGALWPRKSHLAVFGLTAADDPQRMTEVVPCQGCTLARCEFRRPAAKYNVRTKALARWAAERLQLSVRADGSVDALFRYDGTTCSNTGWPLKFDYRVELGPRETGYVIREQSCVPAPEDTGHTWMCEFGRTGKEFLETIAREKPLAGHRLDAVLGWQRALNGPGCFCEASSREHKWGLVLETIHWALMSRGQG